MCPYRDRTRGGGGETLNRSLSYPASLASAHTLRQHLDYPLSWYDYDVRNTMCHSWGQCYSLARRLIPPHTLMVISQLLIDVAHTNFVSWYRRKVNGPTPRIKLNANSTRLNRVPLCPFKPDREGHLVQLKIARYLHSNATARNREAAGAAPV